MRAIVFSCCAFTTQPIAKLMPAHTHHVVFFLSLTLQTMPVGIAYAIWAGSETALIVLVGAMLFKQSPDTDALIGIALILAGIVVINLGSSEISAHSG
jgi:small multidrug resistance pump